MKKIAVGILGATGMVGQKFIELLKDHPWFEITALAASDRSQGKKYGEAIKWRMETPLCPKIAQMQLQVCQAPLECEIVFSGLDSSVAGEIETDFAQKGFTVISNSKNHRMEPNVPLLIPQVNPDHLSLTSKQITKGVIVTNPNCSVAGIATALKPLDQDFGVEKVQVVTLQAVSGAGYPGVPSFDIMDNVIPYIEGEEEKIENETLKILGQLKQNSIELHRMTISAQCNRVAVSNGHMACISVKLSKPATFEQMIQAWEHYSSLAQDRNLPSSPKVPIVYLRDETHPQPKLHRQLNKGMTVTIGRLRKCSLFDWKFTILSHNTILGAAGSALLNAELMYSGKY